MKECFRDRVQRAVVQRPLSGGCRLLRRNDPNGGGLRVVAVGLGQTCEVPHCLRNRVLSRAIFLNQLEHGRTGLVPGTKMLKSDLRSYRSVQR